MDSKLNGATDGNLDDDMDGKLDWQYLQRYDDLINWKTYQKDV